MADPDELIIDAVRGALRSSRRILFATVGASLVVAYIGVTSYADRVTEQAAVERDLAEIGRIINYAEEALKDVSTHALEHRNSPPRDCGALTGIAADAAAASRLRVEAQRTLIEGAISS